jgi:hypothetical protein
MSGLESCSHRINAHNSMSKYTLASGTGLSAAPLTPPKSIDRVCSASASSIQHRGNLVTSLAKLMTRLWRGKAMVYVERDAQGRLLRVEQTPFDGGEHMAVENEELQNWLKMKEDVKARLDSLNTSDLELVRVLEDVVIVLVDRGVIQYTDLPAAAREKLDQRALARADLEGLSTMLRDTGEDHH